MRILFLVSSARSIVLANGSTCNDATVCNGTETCQGGICTAGTPLNCDDGNVCTTDSCSPTSGCQHANVGNGTPCPDATVCNGAEICQSGTCTAGTSLNCNDSNPCTTDSCDPVLGCQLHAPLGIPLLHEHDRHPGGAGDEHRVEETGDMGHR